MRKIFALALMLAPTAACVAEITPPAKDACGAASLQGLVGQDEGVLAAMTFAQPVRIIHPSTPVTMDHRADRLNIEVNAAGAITSVRCG